MDRRRLGPEGEEVAARYLEDAGCRVIARNYRAGRSEVDLVALDGDCLVFVEVRTWCSTAFGSALASVVPAKQRRIRCAAEAFLAGEPGHAGAVRFDLIVVFPGRGGRLEVMEHLRDAF